jgi:hypothetical protein
MAALAAALGLAMLPGACNQISGIGDYHADGEGGGASCPTPCKLTKPQCGCDPGKACTISEEAVKCLAPGLAGPTEECSLTNACQAGLVCAVRGTAATCESFCTSDDECDPPAGLCVLPLTDGHGNTLATTCSDTCSPTTNSGCPTMGTSCQVAKEPSGKMRLFTYCGPSGTTGSTLGQGDPCNPKKNECPPKFQCVGTAGNAQCQQYCDPGKPHCTNGTTCLKFATIGQTEVGVCE